MSSASTADDLTLLLRAWSNGDRRAMDSLTPLVYQELHRAARRYMAREKPGHILQATGLVNETYLRLATIKKIDWQDRGHFYAVCARLMRHILTDHARSRPRIGGEEIQPVPLQEPAAIQDRIDFVYLDEALSRLAAIDKRQSQVVQLRFFVGLTVNEIAEVLEISERTVKNDWMLAKLWLLRELSRGK
jgi:RNA polymerase sigma-70 factor (ECF subfamily)